MSANLWPEYWLHNPLIWSHLHWGQSTLVDLAEWPKPDWLSCGQREQCGGFQLRVDYIFWGLDPQQLFNLHFRDQTKFWLMLRGTCAHIHASLPSFFFCLSFLDVLFSLSTKNIYIYIYIYRSLSISLCLYLCVACLSQYQTCMLQPAQPWPGLVPTPLRPCPCN